MTNALAKQTSPSVPELLDDIVAAGAEYLRRAKGAFSKNTEAAFASDTRIFSEWCADNGRVSLPADAATVADFIDDMAETRAPATVRRYVASIAAMHRAHDVADPTKAEAARLRLKAMSREKGTRQRQAQGITENDVSAIRSHIGGDLAGKRDLALLLTARDMLGRRSEIVGLNLEDVTFSDDGTATVLLRRSKVDQEGEGVDLYLSPQTTAAIHDWIQNADITEGAIFRSLRKGGKVAGRLNEKRVNIIFKQLATAAGIDPQNITGHSCRVGMSLDLTRTGATLPELQQAGRWKSPAMPARYASREAAKHGPVARYHQKVGTAA